MCLSHAFGYVLGRVAERIDFKAEDLVRLAESIPDFLSQETASLPRQRCANNLVFSNSETDE